MIAPYFAWGSIFLVGVWWLVKNESPASINANDPFSLFIPIIVVTFGILGVIMLMIAIFATLRGLTVRKMPASNHNKISSDYYTPAAASLAATGTGLLNTPVKGPSLPIQATLDEPEETNFEQPHVKIIYCQKCNHENPPNALKCQNCGKNLLPGVGASQRVAILISAIFIATLSIVAAILIYRFKPEIGGKDLLYLLALIGFGAFILLFGLILTFRKTALHERYEMRAKRHVSSNPWQAIADLSSAINMAPQIQAFDYLLERAKLHQELGKKAEAKADWQHALENINQRIAVPKSSIDLFKQRAEIFDYLGMEDEYALQMLEYTIEKEKTFKTKRKDIAMGWEEGLKKGSEDMQRQELEKLRTEIMTNQRYKIIGHCKKCRLMVDLNARLECTNNAKHQKITDIRPIIR
jgi:tetratricopeptide (TPR) repeat protein